DSPSPAFYDLYFMKVGGIGLPYLPETDSSWLVTSSKPVLSSGAKVSIYPNPARDKVMIESKAGSVIELMSVTGQLLQREVSQSEQTEMSLTSLHTGIYVLKVDGVSHPLSVIH
ncbi:Por secretion system C-terminal sorting domain-containing protein, partial [Flexibacter flexilis DSM 6793]